MPDIEELMEAWPPEIEEIVGNVNVLTPELDIPLEDYARMVSPEHFGCCRLRGYWKQCQ